MHKTTTNAWNVAETIERVHTIEDECVRTLITGRDRWLHSTVPVGCNNFFLPLIPATRTSVHTLIARFMGPAWGPSGTDRTHVGPMLVQWTCWPNDLCYLGSWYEESYTQFVLRRDLLLFDTCQIYQNHSMLYGPITMGPHECTEISWFAESKDER